MHFFPKKIISGVSGAKNVLEMVGLGGAKKIDPQKGS